MSNWMERFQAFANDDMRAKILDMEKDDFRGKKLSAFLVEVRQQTRGFRKEFKAWCEQIYHEAYRGY